MDVTSRRARTRLACTGIVLLVAGCLFMAQASAQEFHGAGIQKQCNQSKVGDARVCMIRVRNIDEFEDTIEVREVWDIIKPDTVEETRDPASGNLPITGVTEPTSCVVGGSFPCTIGPNGTVTVTSDGYIIQPDDPDPLPDRAHAIVVDLCDGEPDLNCPEGIENELEFAAQTNLFQPSVSVNKDGPDAAKAGDTITFTVLVENTSSADTPDFTCSAQDSLVGDLGTVEFGVPINFDYTLQPGDPNPLTNTVTVSCPFTGFDNVVVESDDHSVTQFDPSITVEKSGPDAAKVGDTITYKVLVENTSSAGTPALNCTLDDSLAGLQGAIEPGTPFSYDYTVQAEDPNPLVNTASVSCSIEGFDNVVDGSDDHFVGLIDPSITVEKSGPDVAKAGDTITYTVLVENTSSANTPALSCTLDDSLVGSQGAIEPGTPFSYDYTVQAEDPNPLVNTASVSCSIEGFDNVVDGSDDHSVDLLQPAVELSKACRPDPVVIGEVISWEITLDNTGDADLDCVVNDPTAGLIDEAVFVAAGTSESVTADRTAEIDDAPAISNTANAECTLAGLDLPNVLAPEDATADCEIQAPRICRTPGFWGTHAGTEKPRSSNLTQIAIDAAGGSLEICGQTIDNTDVGNVASALESICVSPKGDQRLQLARQLTAMALNCVINGSGADCGESSEADLFAAANDACVASGASNDELSSFISEVDDFNNGIDSDCHERSLDESDVFDDVSPLPGPAGSPRACSLARKNGVQILP